jgi:hypothetical protein
MALLQSLVGRFRVDIDAFAFTMRLCCGTSIIKEGLNYINQLIYKYRLCWHGPGLARRTVDIGEQAQGDAAAAVKMSDTLGVVKKGCWN